MSPDDEIPHAPVPDVPHVPVPQAPHVDPTFRPDLVRDLVLFGSAYVEEGTGRRIDPLSVIRRGDTYSVHATGGAFDIARAIRSIPPPPSVGRLHDAMTKMAAELAPALVRTAEAMRNFGNAVLRDANGEPEPLDPRERALRARRNRNTGPSRNPYTHRGIR